MFANKILYAKAEIENKSSNLTKKIIELEKECNQSSIGYHPKIMVYFDTECIINNIQKCSNLIHEIKIIYEIYFKQYDNNQFNTCVVQWINAARKQVITDSDYYSEIHKIFNINYNQEQIKSSFNTAIFMRNSSMIQDYQLMHKASQTLINSFNCISKIIRQAA